MANVWMMSNQQPWTTAVVDGLITCKTRGWGTYLPKPDDLVFLHASKGLWPLWKDLRLVREGIIPDVPNLPRGGVIGYATVDAVGYRPEILPTAESKWFDVFFPEPSTVLDYNCADVQVIRFRDVHRTPFIECKGAQTPRKVLPPEVRSYFEREMSKLQGFELVP